MFYEVNWTRTINTLERINVKYGETHKQIFAFSIIYYLISHPCWWSNLTVLVCIFTRRCSHTLSEMYSVRWHNTRQRWSLWSKNYKWITPGQGLSLGVRVMRLIRRLLKNFTGFSSLFPCRYSNSINRIVFLHRDGAQSAHGRANAQRGGKSQIRYGRWLYRRLKKTSYKLNIFSRTSQPRSHYFPFVWRLVSINYDSKRAGWSRKQSYESISSTQILLSI